MNSFFHYGSVLKVTREDTLEDIENIFIKMKSSGFNTVVIWPAAFWWEDRSSDYPFSTGKKILDIAEKYDLKIVMELAGQLTSMEYAPDFLMKEEYYPVDADGHREFGQSSFGFLNYFHPKVKKIICDHYKKAAEAYKDHPALLGYDIFNETMYRSFDEYTMAEFRIWLEEKYGDIRRLNEVWERTYSSFEQVGYEKWKWMSIMPEADYNAFRKDAIARFLKDWRNAVYSVDNSHIIMADNIYSQVSPIGLYSRPQDDFALKDVCDEIGMSFYPKQNNGTFEPMLRHEIFDGFYAASKRSGFWIAEMQTHIQAIFNSNTCVTVNELKQWCLEGYSAGAKALIYWMWRPFNKGIQTLGRGLVNYKGESTERLELAAELSKLFENIGTIKPLKARIGLLYDPLCEDFQRIFSGNYKQEENIYNLSLFGAYKAFFKNNIRCDIIRLEEIKDYSIIILSNHLVMSEKSAAALAEYANQGGVIIADGRFGTVDETSLLNDSLPGGNLNPLIGEEFFDFDNSESSFVLNGVKIEGCFGREQMKVIDGKIIAQFSDGLPAAVENTVGKGKIITFNTSVWYEYVREDSVSDSAQTLAAMLADEFNLRDIYTDMNVTVRISENAESYYIFVFNYSEEMQCGDISFGDLNKIYVEVKVDDVAVIEVKKEGAK